MQHQNSNKGANADAHAQAEREKKHGHAAECRYGDARAQDGPQARPSGNQDAARADGERRRSADARNEAPRQDPRGGNGQARYRDARAPPERNTIVRARRQQAGGNPGDLKG